jgi:hypothetical protein
MVLCLISTVRFSSGFALQSNDHFPSQAHNNTIDISILECELCKQMAWHIPVSNQDKFDIRTLDIYSLEPFSKPQPKPQHFSSVCEHTSSLSTDKRVSKTSYCITGVCLQCRSYNHWLSDCPRPAQLGSQSNTQSANTGKKVIITEIDKSSVDSFRYLIDGSSYNSDNSTSSIN